MLFFGLLVASELTALRIQFLRIYVARVRVSAKENQEVDSKKYLYGKCD